jgi:peptide-methionine (S)-S-oxide reductase
MVSMRLIHALLAALAVFAAACGASGPALARTESAVFAGGCFWCTEADFEKIPGVVSAVSGYTGGTLANPTYENHAGHLEAVRVIYDPAKVSYAQLVSRYWTTIDPTDDRGQFCDKGPAYRTAVFVSSPAQRQLAEVSRARAAAILKQPVVTPVRDAARFWPAEGYHQDYAKKNPLRYNVYRSGCRRDARLKALWDGRKDVR